MDMKQHLIIVIIYFLPDDIKTNLFWFLDPLDF